MKNIAPIARFENIVVQDLPNETLICDLISNRVFCLNKTASEVWKLCDGKNDVSEISRNLNRKMKIKIDDELVFFALGELANENLLTEKLSSKLAFSGFSRREVIKRIGLGSMVALPLISSVTMPRAIHAQSGGCPAVAPFTVDCPCLLNDDCDGGLYCADNDTCQPLPLTPCGGELSGVCSGLVFCCPTRLSCCNPGIGDPCSYGC